MTTERSSFDDSNVDAILATRDDTMLDTGLDDSQPLGTTERGTTASTTTGSASMGSGTGGGDRLTEAAGGVAERVADTAQRQVGTQVNSGLSRAGDMLEQVANAVRKGGEDMREQQPQIAGFADTAAGQVDKAAQFVRQTDFQGLIREAEGFARRQPAVFLGGALALGLVASRFLKAAPEDGSSRSSRGYRSSYGSRYGDPYGYGGSYGTGYGRSSAGSGSSTRGMTGTGTGESRYGSTTGTATGSATSGTGVEHGGV
jgi:hypothetical protein